MSKKIYLVLIAAVLTVNYAQAQFAFGVRAGLNLANMKMESGNYGAMSPDMRIGVQLGVVGDATLSETFSLQPGVLFAQQGCKFDMSSTSMTMCVNYIQIPVNAQYNVDLGNMKLLLRAGPYLGYAVIGNLKSKVNNKTSSTELDFGGDDGYLNRFDFGLGFGAGLQFGRVQVDLGYNIGLADIGNHTDNFIYKTKNNGLVLAVSYFWRKN